MPDQLQLQGIKDPIGGQSQITPFHDLYTTFNVGRPVIQDVDFNAFSSKSAASDLLMGNQRDPLRRDIEPISTSLAVVDPFLDNEDGIGKYGYSDFLNNGDNEDRYAQNFKKDNPSLFEFGLKSSLYWGLGFLEKTLESAAVKTGQGLAGLFNMITQAPGAIFGQAMDIVNDTNKQTFTGFLQDSQDSILSSVFNGWEDNLKSRYDYFQEKSDRDKKGFVASLSDGDFWMNDISDGLSFLASAMLEVGLISKLGLGARAANLVSKTARGVSTAAIEGADFAKNASRTGRFLNGLGFEGSGNLLIKNAVDVTAQTLATTTIESAVEANETRTAIYDALNDKINPETGFTYTDDERKRLSAEGAANVFNQNMLTLIGPNLLQTVVFNRLGNAFKSKFMKGSVKNEGSQSANLSAVDKTLKGGVKVDRVSSLKRLGKFGSAALLGFGSEGLWEENMQLAISRQAQEVFGGTEYSDDSPGTTAEAIEKQNMRDDLIGSYSNVGARYVDQTRQFYDGLFDKRFIDDELSKSIGLGGLFGVLGAGAHVAVEGISKQQRKINEHWLNQINERTKSLFEPNNFFETEMVADPNDPTKQVPKMIINPSTGKPQLDKAKIRAFFAGQVQLEEIQQVIAATEVAGENNDASLKALNKTAKTMLFAQLADEYSRAGKTNLLIDLVNSSKGFTDEEITALGFEPGGMTAEEKADMQKQLITIARQQDAKNQWIDNNVLDNQRDPAEGRFGLVQSKKQKQDRRDRFEAKKAYLRKLGTQRILMDTHIQALKEENQDRLNAPIEEFLVSSVLDENGMLIKNPDGTLNLDPQYADIVQDHILNRMIAADNTRQALEEELAVQWESIKQTEYFSRQKNRTGSTQDEFKRRGAISMAAAQVKLDETLERLEEVARMLETHQYTLKELEVNNPTIEKVAGKAGGLSVDIKQRKAASTLSMEEQENKKRAQINNVIIEELSLRKKWILEEWQNVAALTEPKAVQTNLLKRTDRMRLSKRTYNKFFEREVMTRDNAPGIDKLRLAKDKIDAKKYKANEEKLLRRVRIQGRILDIVAKVNGEKLITELEHLTGQNLPSNEFEAQLGDIIKRYNGKARVVPSTTKDLVSVQLSDLEDEYNFVSDLLENFPEDDRFNDTYYNTNSDGTYVVKPEFDSIPAIANVTRELANRIANLENLQLFLEKTPSEIQGDWSDLNKVRKRIADVYTDPSDNIINTYNTLSNNGQSDVAGDSLSTKQDLDMIDEELAELEQLKTIFQTRNDGVLESAPFENFIENIDTRIEQLNKIRDIVKERLSSRLKENQNFLVDAVNNTVNELGLSYDGTIVNQPLHDTIERVVSPEVLSKLKTALTDIAQLTTASEIDEAYWTINGAAAAILEVIKKEGKDQVLAEVQRQRQEKITQLQSTTFMGTIANEKIGKRVLANIGDSVLGSLQALFNSSYFTKIGQGKDEDFIDDKPSSPVYRFRDNLNLRKFIRDQGTDTARNENNSEVSQADLMEFLPIMQNLQNLEDLEKKLGSTLNQLDQIEREKEIVQLKIAGDSSYQNMIVPSIQQLFFVRGVANFLRRETTGKGFRNWLFIQAPGGAGKTQTLGTWFNKISGITSDRVIATAFTEEASRGIKKAMLVGESGPKDVSETIDFIKDLTAKKNYDFDVLIVDEYPAITTSLQKELFDAVSEFTEAKKQAGKGEFKVITMGDTNQLTFVGEDLIAPQSAMILNPIGFLPDNSSATRAFQDNDIAKINILPSLTVNFRSNLFPITSFIDQFKGSSVNTTNQELKVISTDSMLLTPDVKGVVNIAKGDFKAKVLNYLKLNEQSPRTKAIIVNEARVEEFKNYLKSNGINIIEDPNDTVTKGVYVTSVKNSQGFSFDEVFIDLERNDPKLFGNMANPDYLYNKAMYVATSRARNLIAVTNFPNFQNTEDPSIAALENKALSELQTKDANFVSQRDTEINGAKLVFGDNYARNVTNPAPQTAKPQDPVTTTLDVVEDEEEDEDDTNTDEQEEAQEELDKENIKEDEEPAKSAESTSTESAEDDFIDNEQIEPSEGLEEDLQEEESVQDKNSFKESVRQKVEQIQNAVSKLKDNVVNLLFPTSQTIKFKMQDGVFTMKPAEGSLAEYRSLKDSDEVTVIPFQQTKGTNSPRKFGYAIVTPAKDATGAVIPNEMRTVGIFSDKEINDLKESNSPVFAAIVENEKLDKGFVNISYQDVNDPNGFRTSNNKTPIELITGKVSHVNPITYFRGKEKTMDQAQLDSMINTYIDEFYKNHLDSFAKDRARERARIAEFYKDPANAKIVIPTLKEINKKTLRYPTDFVLRPGRPYLMLEPIPEHKKAAPQYIPLNRKMLDSKLHGEVLNPIREFITTAKAVKADLRSKGVTSRMGYSQNIGAILSKVAAQYVEGQSNTITVDYFAAENNGKVKKSITFNPAEAARAAKLYQLFKVPSTDIQKAETPKEIESLVKGGKTRVYTFVDGEEIKGKITSFDPKTNSFTIEDSETGESTEKTGAITHSGTSTIGEAQQALNDIFLSNGNISRQFTSREGVVGFITDRQQRPGTRGKGYQFMSLLGRKTAAVVKSFNKDGSPKEYFEDVIDILETLFNFNTPGQLPASNIQGVNIQLRVPVKRQQFAQDGFLDHDYTASSDNTSRDSAIANRKYFETNFDSMAPSQVMIDFNQNITPTTSTNTVENTDSAKMTAINAQIDALSDDNLYIVHLTNEDNAVNIFNSALIMPAGAASTTRVVNKEQLKTIIAGLLEGKSEHRGYLDLFIATINRKTLSEQTGKTQGDKLDNYIIDNYLDSAARTELPADLNLGYFSYNNGTLTLKEQKKTETSKPDLKTLNFAELETAITAEQKAKILPTLLGDGYTSLEQFFAEWRNAAPQEQDEAKNYLIDCLL